jgi:hypothetical protein
MAEATPRGVTGRARSLTPRGAVLTGGGLMVAGLAIFAVMLLAGASLPSLDATGLLVVMVVLAGLALLWMGPVVVAVAGGQPAWVGAIAFPVGYAVVLVGTVLAGSFTDGVTLAVVEVALPVFGYAGALAVVGGGRVWRRLAGVAVIAGLWGAIGYPLQGVVGLGLVGLSVAVGFLAWVAPRARPPSTAGTPVVTGHSDS